MSKEIPDSAKFPLGYWKHKNVTPASDTTYTPHDLFSEMANAAFVICSVVPQPTASCNATFCDGSFRTGMALTTLATAVSPFYGGFKNVRVATGSTVDIYMRPATRDELLAMGI